MQWKLKWSCLKMPIFLPTHYHTGVSVQGGLCPGGLCREGLCLGGLCLGVSLWGDLCHGGSPWQRFPFPCEQNEWQISIKTLPCCNFVVGSKYLSWSLHILVNVWFTQWHCAYSNWSDQRIFPFDIRFTEKILEIHPQFKIVSAWLQIQQIHVIVFHTNFIFAANKCLGN